MPKILDFRRICDEHRIPYWTEGYKQCGVGWIQMECPFCIGNPGPHLGYNEERGYFNCWRCGGHSPAKVIATILNISFGAARSIAEDSTTVHAIDKAIKVRVRRECKWPAGTGEIKAVHKRYLEGRGYDSKRLASIWGLRGTGPLGRYKFRVIAPVFAPDGRMVSYTGRDVTGRSDLRYKSCRAEDEAENHKHHLYGLWLAREDFCVVVEGPADAWRLGPGAVATFGIEYRPQQVKRMRRFERRFVLFDHADPQARRQARKLASELSVFPGRTWNIDIGWKDPGEMPQAEADALKRELAKTK